MVRLEEVEDETFFEKGDATKDGALLDDDDDFTDTDSEISDASDLASLSNDETLIDRISALRDIIPPKTRTTISNFTSTVFNATTSTLTFGGKGVWILATSLLLVGVPYAIALQEEQAIMEEEKQRSLMAEGAQGLVDGGVGSDAKPAL